MKRNAVDLDFCKHVVAYRHTVKSGRDEEARECFKVFDKKERNTVNVSEIKSTLLEYISPGLSDEDVKEFMKEIDPDNNGHIA